MKFIGKWDLEIDVETLTSSKFREFYLDFVEQFKKNIKESDTCPVYFTHKKAFLPLSFFSSDKDKAENSISKSRTKSNNKQINNNDKNKK